MDSKKRVILVRHGETWDNREGRIMGSSDSPLTPEGIQVAKLLAKSIVNEKISVAFSSSLGRALSSAEIYTRDINCPVLPRPAMCELACGLWEGRIRTEAEPGRTAIRTTWYDRPPGGESYSDAEDRVGSFIRELNSSDYSNPVLVVGHAGINRVFLKLWLGLPPDHAIRILFAHDMLYVLDGKSLSGMSVSLGRLDGLMV
ncbi:MAG: histidine phosphatase family protein [Desulfomonile tiedjei]|uniref:Histidine phosphatase family protein n=1 Tax=Desulfomonile tiedjei TaxID=2358 RepID=A0A9D6Z4T7_9BACT|nr:histidine phosphatase family protein [Desulfomonile tiedjei]